MGRCDIKIVFISYLNRSGSTYLSNLLSKSSEICVCPESDALVELLLLRPAKFPGSSTLKKLKIAIISEPKLSAWKLSQGILNKISGDSTCFEYFIHIVKGYRDQVKPDAGTIVFKAERLIHLYLPLHSHCHSRYSLKWISIIRDSRAIYNSQKNTYFPGTVRKMANSPVVTAMRWNVFLRKNLQYTVFSDFFLIYFEKLVQDVNNEFDAVIKFLGIKSFNVMSVTGDLSIRLPDSHKRIHERIDELPNTDTISKWRQGLNLWEKWVLQYLNKKYLRQFDYSILNFRRSTLIFAIIAYTLVLYYSELSFCKRVIFKLWSFCKD
jgi:hypothetical protein